MERTVDYAVFVHTYSLTIQSEERTIQSEEQPQQSSQPSISMQEPVVGSSAEPVSNTYGVNIVEVNAGENIPTAVAVPVAG